MLGAQLETWLRAGRFAAWLTLGLCFIPPTLPAQVPIETVGRVETLEPPLGPHWVWASDPVNERMALVDLRDGRMLGTVDGGWGVTTGLFSDVRNEFYVPATYYSRGSRGVRTDVVTAYDGFTLAPVGEVVIPPKRAINALPSGNAALLDDARFAVIFNQTPASSVSVVDVENRRFAGEIATPGCSLVYASGPRRFFMICGDGSLLSIVLDEEGRASSRIRTHPFFDPKIDPVMEKAARIENRWFFISFQGWVHEVDVTGPEPEFAPRWALLDEGDRADSWLPGGPQPVAAHAGLGRLYVLMHQGGVDTHKQHGTEAWVYDVNRQQRVLRVPMRNPGFTYLGVSMEFGREWVWPFNGLYGFLVDSLAGELGVAELAVTRDARPLLVAGSYFSGALAVYSAESGEFIRRLVTGNMTDAVLRTPYRPQEDAR